MPAMHLDILYVGANDIAAVLDRNNPLHKEVVVHDALEMTFLAMNNRIPPFDDEGVRQAFALAIDRAAIVEQVFSQTVGKATALLPPSLARNGDAETVDFDISKARQALADSRYGDASNIPELAFVVPGTRGPVPPTVVALINMIQQHLGVDVRIQREVWSTFVENLERRDNPYQLFLFTWHADYPDPQAVLDPLFRSSSVTNYSGYRSPEVDALLLQARGEHDSDRRRQTIAEIEELDRGRNARDCLVAWQVIRPRQTVGAGRSAFRDGAALAESSLPGLVTAAGHAVRWVLELGRPRPSFHDHPRCN